MRRLLPATLSAAMAFSVLAAAPTDRPEQAQRGLQQASVATAADTTTAQPRVVVSPIDSGINPYHEAFDVDVPAVDEHVLAEFGIDEEHILHISDDYDADLAAGVYADVEEHELYWFAGTNILAWSVNFGDRPFLPDDSGDTHGTGVTGAVLAANPDAIVLFVEGMTDTGVSADAERYAFTHPGVDIVTTSYGFFTSAPLGALAGSYEGVVEMGKLHFGASANDPTLAPSDGTSGPWWAIGIAGFGEGEDGGGGKETFSGTAPDFVADWTQDLPYCDTCTEGTESVSGTSFATPRSAGVASAVLLEARRAAGHLGGVTDGLLVTSDDGGISNWQLRRALEEGAAVPPQVDRAGLTEVPVNSIAPYAQVGWGLITADPEQAVVENTLAALSGQTFKDAATCDFMTHYMTLRFAAWDANPLSDSFGQTNAVENTSGYLPC
ncbi:MAG: S8/S53 family peptidase [Actinobacteria bacterium]|nr:S8/S53 family peptidase [Actinomycetota bacterium]